MSLDLEPRNIRRLLLVITFTVLLFLAVQNIAAILQVLKWTLHILKPLLWGLALAFVLNVPMTALEKHLFSRPWRHLDYLRRRGYRAFSISLTVIVITLALALIFALLIPELIRSISVLSMQVPSVVLNLQHWLSEQSQTVPFLTVLLERLDLEQLIRQLTSWLSSASVSIASLALSLTQQVVSTLFNLIMALTLALYMLAKKERLSSQFRSLIYSYLPEKRADQILAVGRLSNSTFSGFITGSLLESLILGILIYVTNLLFSFPYATMIAVMIGILRLIPVFGAIVGCLIGMVLVSMDSPLLALVFMLVNIVVQQFESNIIYPRVMGSQVGLPGIWVLAATVIGGAVAGVPGILLSIPLCSIAYVLMSHSVHQRLQAKRIPHYKTHSSQH